MKKLLADRKKDYYNVDNETYYMIAMLTKSKELLEYSGNNEGEEGRAEGREEEKINVAKNLLDILSDEVIAEKVGGDIEVVRELRK